MKPHVQSANASYPSIGRTKEYIIDFQALYCWLVSLVACDDDHHDDDDHDDDDEVHYWRVSLHSVLLELSVFLSLRVCAMSGSSLTF